MSTTITLKISKKMAALLTGIIPEGGTVAAIAAEVAAGRVAADGSVTVETERENGMALLGIAKGRMSMLDAALLSAEGPDKHKLLGEHSAWRALAKQLPEFTPAA
jgi:hypothetical protein